MLQMLLSSDSDAIRWSGLHSPVHWDHTGLLWPIHPGIALQQQRNKSHLPFILGRAPPPFPVATPLPTNKPKVVTNKKELKILPRKKSQFPRQKSRASARSRADSRQASPLKWKRKYLCICFCFLQTIDILKT